MAYPKGYVPIHVKRELRDEIDEIKDFGEIDRQSKLRAIIRFYRQKKNV